MLRRLDKAFVASFRRSSHGEQPDSPRFKRTRRSHRFPSPDRAGWNLAGNRLRMAGVGEGRVRVQRDLEGTRTPVTLRRAVDQWSGPCSCEAEEPAPQPRSGRAPGSDLGVLRFARLSPGELMENPRHLRRGLKRIKGLAQVKDRPKEGRQRRQRAALALARAQRTVRTQRANFHHQLAHRLVNASGLIAMEDLRISHLTQAPEPKPDPDQEGHELPTGKAAKAGLNHSSVAAAWASSNPSASTQLRRLGGAWCWETPPLPARYAAAVLA